MSQVLGGLVSDGAQGDELVPDHACKLSPRGLTTFSPGARWKEAADSLPSSSSSSSSSSPRRPRSLFSRSHMGGRFELDRELNHVSPAWMSWLCAERHKLPDISWEHSLSSPSLPLFSITPRPFMSFCLSLSLLLFPPLFLPRRGDPGVSSQEPARCFVQTSGKMFHFFFFFFFYFI